MFVAVDFEDVLGIWPARPPSPVALLKPFARRERSVHNRRMRYVVAYDIRSDTLRRRVLHLLKNYGMPVQFSVVECDLTYPRFQKLREQLAAMITGRRDRVSFYAQCEGCVPRTDRLGAAPKVLDL